MPAVLVLAVGLQPALHVRADLGDVLEQRAVLVVGRRHFLFILTLGCPPEHTLEGAQARDLDTLRFRADSRINGIIRELASAADPSRLSLVDNDLAFKRDSQPYSPGWELFYEHAQDHQLALAPAQIAAM